MSGRPLAPWEGPDAGGERAWTAGPVAQAGQQSVVTDWSGTVRDEALAMARDRTVPAMARVRALELLAQVLGIVKNPEKPSGSKGLGDMTRAELLALTGEPVLSAVEKDEQKQLLSSGPRH